MTVEANENWGLHPRYTEISVKLLKIAQPFSFSVIWIGPLENPITNENNNEWDEQLSFSSVSISYTWGFRLENKKT